MARRFHFYSRPGKGKTSAALTGKGKTWYGEFDVGSFDRAIAGLDIDKNLIEVHRYHPPIDLKNRGVVSTAMAGASLKGPTFIARRLHGYSEVMDRFLNEYEDALKSGNFSTFVLDTESVLNDLIKDDYLERIQDEVSEKREVLQRSEYHEREVVMTSVINAPISVGSDVILISHMKELWEGGQATGKFGPDGWNKVDDFSDCTLEFNIENKEPVAYIRKVGAGGMKLDGMRIEKPTITAICELLDAGAKLQAAKQPVPSEYTQVLVKAALV